MTSFSRRLLRPTAASVALLLAAAMALYAGIRVVTRDPVPTTRHLSATGSNPAPPDTATAKDATSESPRSDSAASPRFDSTVLAAVARDPFRADRRRPPGRYRPPESGTLRTGEDGGRVPLPAVQVVGLAVGPPGQGLAALSGPDGPRLVRPGERFAGFRLVTIEAGTVRLVGHDTVLVLSLDSPVSRIREVP